MGKTSEERRRIAVRLRLARETSGLSQGQVAQMLGLHRPTVSEIEAGRRKVAADELAKLAELYGVSSSWLIREAEGEDAEVQEKLALAARELSKLKKDDLDRLLKVLGSLRSGESK